MINLIVSLATLLCAILYRMGGSGNYKRYFRVVFIPIILALLSFILGVKSLWLLLMIPATIGAISTYWDEVPFNKGEDNFWMHGFFVGLAAFPIAIITGHWWLFIIRCLILAVWSGVWSLIWKWDVVEESGRLLPLVPTLLMII